VKLATPLPCWSRGDAAGGQQCTWTFKDVRGRSRTTVDGHTFYGPCRYCYLMGTFKKKIGISPTLLNPF
jgi:hypothetical protein